MSAWERLEPPAAMPDTSVGLAVQVVWVDANRHWSIWMSKQYVCGHGKLEGRDVYKGHFGQEECPTAYQALMAAMSDYRTRG